MHQWQRLIEAWGRVQAWRGRARVRACACPPAAPAEAGTLKRQLADAHSVDSSDLQRRLKDVTDMLYLKQTQVGRGRSTHLRPC